MTQVPRPQWLSGIPVVPESASTSESPAAARTAPKAVAPVERLAAALKREGDRESSIGFNLRYWGPIADRLVADTKLLDALIAYRLGGATLRYFVSNVEPGEGVHADSADARAELASRRAEFPTEGWFLYAIADITERPTDA